MSSSGCATARAAWLCASAASRRCLSAIMAAKLPRHSSSHTASMPGSLAASTCAAAGAPVRLSARVRASAAGAAPAPRGAPVRPRGPGEQELDAKGCRGSCKGAGLRLCCQG